MSDPSWNQRLPLMIDLSTTAVMPDERELLRERRIVGVCVFGWNIHDRFQLADYVAELRELAGEDLIVAIDQEGGGVLRLHDVPTPPSAMALGAADDVELTRQVAAAAARGLKAVGVNLNFAPVADVNSNPANPVIADRSFGGDPALVARHVIAYLRGMQGEGIAATLKHFPGHGDTDVDSHLDLPRIGHDLDTLERVDLAPFQAGITAGAAAVMTAHIVVPAIDPDLPGTMSAKVLRGLLRERLGFGGMIVTDALNMRAVTDRWPAPEAAVLSLAAGADLPVNMGGVELDRGVIAAIEAAVAAGRLDPAEMEASKARIRAVADGYRAALRPDPSTAWAADGSDEPLLEAAARRAVTALGKLPHLRAGDEVILISAERVSASAASDVVGQPADAFAEALHRRGIRLRRLPTDKASVPRLAAMLETAAALVFASTSRLRISEGEAQLAQEAAGIAAARGIPFVHAALWNPYSVAAVPGPALVSFGYRRHAAEAAASALTGGEITATSPVPLAVLSSA